MNTYQNDENKEISIEEVRERLIKKLMWDGKKSLAIDICDEALEIAGKELDCEPLEALEKAIEKVKPLLEVKSRRVGGATYQVPVKVTQLRGVQLSIRWLVGFARSSKGISMAQSLANELINAAKGQGAAINKRETIHKMAKANKAFAHYSW
ncbi:MAG: 30S ribosomal protein S7 [Elusimicrobiota bacterium]